MESKKRVATIGTFDGVHRGHRAVIETLKNCAAAGSSIPTVITFDRHPLATIAPQRTPPLIMPRPDRDSMLRNMGVEVIVVPFTRELMSLTAAQWLSRLKAKMDVDTVIVGFDNTFGCDGIEMSIADYQRIGRELAIDVKAAPMVDGVSSSIIRRAVAAGEIEKAAELLGRNFSLKGKVVAGKQLGRRIGFPTANLDVDAEMLIPLRGVYAADAILPDGETRRAVVNIGTRPTVDSNEKVSIEAHILDWTGNLYGHQVELRFLRRLRDEKRFPDLASLTAAIEADASAARLIP